MARKKVDQAFKTDVKHLAIIMDGNGRWAKKRGMPRTFGHMHGAENIFTITKAAMQFGIDVITIYAFSTENWKRPADEIAFLFHYLEDNFSKRIDEIMENNIRVMTIGQLERLPESTQKVINETIARSKSNTGIVLNIALSYGSRPEILSAVQKIIGDVQADKVKASELDEEKFASYLQTAELPPVDLLIRTSGEVRLSNFLLWQLAYAEMIFTPVAWPDFTPAELQACLEHYQNRQRRFGGL